MADSQTFKAAAFVMTLAFVASDDLLLTAMKDELSYLRWLLPAVIVAGGIAMLAMTHGWDDADKKAALESERAYELSISKAYLREGDARRAAEARDAEIIAKLRR